MIRSSRSGRLVVGIVVGGAALLLGSCTTAGEIPKPVTPAAVDSTLVRRSAVPVHPPTAATLSPTPAAGTGVADPAAAVGALFPQGTGHPHSCTATVVASVSGDVVMTAAHCVSGHAAGLVFVPGYDEGRAPFGSWPVTGAFAPPGWLAGQHPDDDVAFLVLAPGGPGAPVPVQQLTGAVSLGTGATDGERVTLTAYNDGIDDSPVRCTTAVRHVDQHPTIYCHGFTGGSSGTAWLAAQGTAVVAVGLIGGLHQGGCEEYTSYSPPFGPDVSATLAAAGAPGATSQELPAPPGDGCSAS